MTEIHFGTDGWRAQIAEDYTFDNVRALTQATADYLRREGLADQGVVVGYDTRFLSGSFAGAVAEVLAANEIHTWLTSTVAPTPAVSYAVLQQQAGLGIIITASHNPARWNGFKVKPSYGGSAPAEVTEPIEQAVPGVIAAGRVQRIALGEAEARGLVDRFDPRAPYLAAIREFVDLDAIRDAGLTVMHDPLYGASAGWLVEAVGEGRTHLHELHATRNPAFPGIRAPEPIAANLGELMERMAQGGYDVGFANDGDADRFAVVDEHGNYLTSLVTFALLAHYFLEVRGQRGAIIRSVTSSRMLDRLGEIYGCPVTVTPVGFKNIGPEMMAQDALMGGEESGGYGYRGHIPERDGVLSALYFLDYMVRTGKRPSALVAGLYELVGPHAYDRVDVTLRGDEREAILARVAQAAPETVAGLRVVERDRMDGFRFVLEDGWWLLLRFSGTEPLLRIYAEMPTAEQVRIALEVGQQIAGATL